MDDNHLDEYFKKLDASDRLLDTVPPFMATTVHLLAKLYYRQYVGNAISPSGEDPAEMRQAHEVALMATERTMADYVSVFGQEHWNSVWSILKGILSAPTEVIIRHAEEKHRG